MLKKTELWKAKNLITPKIKATAEKQKVNSPQDVRAHLQLRQSKQMSTEFLKC